MHPRCRCPQMDKSAVMQQLALASLTTPSAEPPSPSASPQAPAMTRSRAAAAANILEAMLLRARTLVRAAVSGACPRASL